MYSEIVAVADKWQKVASGKWRLVWLMVLSSALLCIPLKV